MAPLIRFIGFKTWNLTLTRWWCQVLFWWIFASKFGEVSFHVVICSSNWFETTSWSCVGMKPISFVELPSINLTPEGSSKLHNGPVHRRLSGPLKTGKGSPDLSKCPLHVNWFSRWWFQLFSIFTPTWGSDPIWLMCFSTGCFNHQPVLDSNWF